MKNKHIIPNIYPILFIIYPILALYTANQEYVRFADTIRSLIYAIAGFGFLWFIVWFLTKSIEKSNAMVSLLSLLFFSYGHIYLLAQRWFGEGFSHKYLLSVYTVITISFSWLIISKLTRTSQAQSFLGVFSLILIGMALFQTTWHELRARQNPDSLHLSQYTVEEVEVNDNLPDIYLIILDAHTRSDILLKDYGLDNSEFIYSLEQLGFYVADCSQSNYPITDLALQSLFNMDYVHKFIDEGSVLPGLKNSIVKQTMETQGYITIAFYNYFSSHYDLDPEIQLKRNTSITERVNLFTGLSEFEQLVVETSALRLMVDFQYLLDDYFGELFSDEGKYYSHYLETLFILEQLMELPESPAQKFVFAHIAVPHWPFVFSEEGNYDHNWNLSDQEGYPKNVRFIDQQITPVLEKIISNSEKPPVIILMGDHGPTGKSVAIESRISNLYAVFAEEEILNRLSPWSTPVNTFRLISNHFYGTNYPLVEDVSYRIWNNDSYNLDKVVPNKCNPQ